MNYERLNELLTLKSNKNSISLLDLFKNVVINNANPIIQTKFNRLGLQDDYMIVVNVALGTLGGNA